jgi:hypothetical protein
MVFHNHSPSVESLFASQELVIQRWEPERLSNTVPRYFFGSVFVQ